MIRTADSTQELCYQNSLRRRYEIVADLPGIQPRFSTSV